MTNFTKYENLRQWLVNCCKRPNYMIDRSTIFSGTCPDSVLGDIQRLFIIETEENISTFFASVKKQAVSEALSVNDSNDTPEDYSSKLGWPNETD